MKYVIGVDLGTSSVKAILVDKDGNVCCESSQSYPLSQPQVGYSEQNPTDWFEKTIIVIKEIVEKCSLSKDSVEGISFSGQMHGLVLIDSIGNVIRPAILWNDTRTTKECEYIKDNLGDSLLEIAKNKALEGFTLPKILWVKRNELDSFENTSVFLLPKDYVRYKLTGKIGMEYSDGAGTLLMDIEKREWSEKICKTLDIPLSICPPLMASYDMAGTLLPEIADQVGLDTNVKIFAGGADNACGAVGAGIINEDRALCSIGTSGVMLSYDDTALNLEGRLHMFNHSIPNAFYSMGVTLSAGYSLDWFKNTFAENTNFDTLLNDTIEIPAGACGLLYTPYIMGERTPHTDSKIRGSFIGISSSHEIKHFTKSVIEGITFSIRDCLEIMRETKKIDNIVSIGGGAKNKIWLQMQADIFNANILKIKGEQGPALGAAIIAAVGCGWFESFEKCIDKFICYEEEYKPIEANVEKYNKVYNVYKDIYYKTKEINEKLYDIRINE